MASDRTVQSGVGGGTPPVDFWAAGLGVLLIAGTLIVFLIAQGQGFPRETSIGLAALECLVMLAVSLTGLIVVTSALGLTSRGAALGLPPGSVRALLAFSLVIIFVAVASWTLNGFIEVTRGMGGPLEIFASDLSADQVKAKMEEAKALPLAANLILIPRETGKDTTGKPKYALDLHAKVDPGSQQQIFDAAKQILTIVATVLVTVIGFYFGSNATKDAINAASAQIRDTQKALADKKPDGADPAKIAADVKTMASSADAKLAGLGADPLVPLRSAAANRTDEPYKTNLPAAEAAFKALGQSVIMLRQYASRADTLLKEPRTDASDDALDTSTKLLALKTEAGAANDTFNKSHDAFVAARKAMTEAKTTGP